MKAIVFISLMLIGVLYAARMSCDSCGPECERSCGTRRFRACCFNYLRKKRGPETVEFWTSITEEDQPNSKAPAGVFRYNPEDLIPGIFASNLQITSKMVENQAI